MKLSERQLEILAAFEHTGSFSEAARYLGISRQRVCQVVTGYKSGKLKGHTPDYYKDTGCPDGLYPSCLNCPEEFCRFP